MVAEARPSGIMVHSSTRIPLPAERPGIIKTFRLRGQPPFHLVVGFYEDGRVGELSLFDRMEDRRAHELMSQILTAASLGLQSGTPLEHYTRRWRGTIFEPAGFTEEPEFPIVSSSLDYIAQYLEAKFAIR